MTPSRLLTALLLSSLAIAVRAEDAKPPEINCDGPTDGLAELKPVACDGSATGTKTKWRGPMCPGPQVWDAYVFDWQHLGNIDDKFKKDHPGKSDEERMAHYHNAKIPALRKALPLAFMSRINKNVDSFNLFLKNYALLQKACGDYKKDSNPKTSDAFAAAKAEMDKPAGELTKSRNDPSIKYNFDKGFDTPIVSLDNVFRDRKPAPKSQFDALNAAVGKWQASFQAVGDYTKKQNAALEAEQKAKVDEFNAQKGAYRTRLKSGDETALADELRSAFDKAGFTSVRVNTPVKNADGTVSVNIDMKKEDWDKVGNQAQKEALMAKLKALGVPDVKIGEDVHQRLRFPTADEGRSIDDFERVIFDKKGTLSIKYDSISKTVSDGAADAAVKAALGSSVSEAASDAYKKKELDDKIRKLGNKYNADYLEASADLKKECEKSYAKIKELGGGTAPKEKECAEAQGKLDRDHAEKLRALGEQQSGADVARAADGGENLKAYRDLLDLKVKAYAKIQQDSASALWRQRNKINLGKLKTLTAKIIAEKKIVESAIAKIPDVQAGKLKLSDLSNLDKGTASKGVIQAAFDSNSADELFSSRHGDEEDGAFDREKAQGLYNFDYAN